MAGVARRLDRDGGQIEPAGQLSILRQSIDNNINIAFELIVYIH